MSGRLDGETRHVVELLAQVSRRMLAHGITDVEAFADALHAVLKTGSPLPLERATRAFAALDDEWRRIFIDTVSVAMERSLARPRSMEDLPEDDLNGNDLAGKESETAFWSLLPVLQPSGVTARERLRADRKGLRRG